MKHSFEISDNSSALLSPDMVSWLAPAGVDFTFRLACFCQTLSGNDEEVALQNNGLQLSVRFVCLVKNRTFSMLQHGLPFCSLLEEVMHHYYFCISKPSLNRVNYYIDYTTAYKCVTIIMSCHISVSRTTWQRLCMKSTLSLKAAVTVSCLFQPKKLFLQPQRSISVLTFST